MKRAFDLIIACAGLFLLSPLFIIVAVAIKLDSEGPIFFRQERMGRRFRPFLIYKFRTMIVDAPRQGRSLTVGNDFRITTTGRFLRKTKLDELPQLINIVRGEMSFVGPRPELPKFVAIFHSDYEEVLKVRPGITDLASLKYRSEAEFLGQFENPEEEYLTRVLPDKIKLAKEYIRRSNLLFDLIIIIKTLFRVFDDKFSYGRGRNNLGPC